MTTDSETNFLYLADTLPKKYPAFFKEFKQVINSLQVPFGLLPYTKDVWAVDYMPVQVSPEEYIQFVYNPDYLQSKKWQKTISKVDDTCAAIGVKPKKSSIILDGGNVVRAATKVILCDKVFLENRHLPEKQLIKELEKLFRVDQVIFIPTQPKDFTGHADGMVRFLDDRTVLINDFSREKHDFQIRFRLALHNAGLNWIEVPYNPYGNSKELFATGIYINFLQVDKV